MSSQVKTGWICIATAGPTLDGRTVSPECLRELADTYDTSFYIATPYRPNQPPAPAADRSDDPSHANHYRLC